MGACFVTAASRGKKVVEAFLGDRRPDVWVSDRLAAQMGWARVDHQVCLAHLIRDVQYAMDAGDAAFAPGMMGLLKRAVGIGRRRQTLADSTLVHSLPASEKARHLARDHAYDRGRTEAPAYHQALPPKPVRVRHQPGRPANQQWLRTGAPPCVVFRKVTNCFRSAWSASLYADVRSVFETARRQAIPILQAIRLTLDARLLPVGT